MRCLVIEDDDGLCGAIRESLRHAVPGLEVSADLSGREAIRRVLNGFRPDVALVDLLLPDTSGLEVAATLRSLGVHRIVGMTGQHEPPVDDILELFDDFLVKPFELRALEGLFLAPAGWCYREERTPDPLSRIAR